MLNLFSFLALCILANSQSCKLCVQDHPNRDTNKPGKCLGKGACLLRGSPGEDPYTCEINPTYFPSKDKCVEERGVWCEPCSESCTYQVSNPLGTPKAPNGGNIRRVAFQGEIYSSELACEALATRMNSIAYEYSAWCWIYGPTSLNKYWAGGKFVMSKVIQLSNGVGSIDRWNPDPSVTVARTCSRQSDGTCSWSDVGQLGYPKGKGNARVYKLAISLDDGINGQKITDGAHCQSICGRLDNAIAMVLSGWCWCYLSSNKLEDFGADIAHSFWDDSTVNSVAFWRSNPGVKRSAQKVCSACKWQLSNPIGTPKDPNGGVLRRVAFQGEIYSSAEACEALANRMNSIAYEYSGWCWVYGPTSLNKYWAGQKFVMSKVINLHLANAVGKIDRWIPDRSVTVARTCSRRSGGTCSWSDVGQLGYPVGKGNAQIYWLAIALTDGINGQKITDGDHCQSICGRLDNAIAMALNGPLTGWCWCYLSSNKMEDFGIDIAHSFWVGSTVDSVASWISKPGILKSAERVCSAPVKCPIFDACPPNFTSVESTDSDGCRHITCKKPARTVNCPIFDACPPGYTSEGSKDSNGCPRITCKEPTPVICPIFDACPPFYISEQSTDSNGCARITCKKPTSLAETDMQGDESAVSYTMEELKRTNTMLKKTLLSLTEAN